MATKQEIENKIISLSESTEKNSITPTILGGILSDLNNSTIPNWETKTYSTGELVFHNNGIWRSEVSNNETEPAPPIESTYEKITIEPVDYYLKPSQATIDKMEDYISQMTDERRIIMYRALLNLYTNVGDLEICENASPIIFENIDGNLQNLDTIPAGSRVLLISEGMCLLAFTNEEIPPNTDLTPILEELMSSLSGGGIKSDGTATDSSTTIPPSDTKDNRRMTLRNITLVQASAILMYEMLLNDGKKSSDFLNMFNSMGGIIADVTGTYKIIKSPFKMSLDENDIPYFDFSDLNSISWKLLANISIGSESSAVTLTKVELDTHITNSTLIPGVLYGIKETERWMLLGDSTDTLFLRAISTNQLETKGTGKFFVPKYDQSINGYGIWQGQVYEVFPTTVPEPTYAVGNKVIWGGRLWNNVSGNLGTKVDIYTLSADWEVIPFNETDYNVRFDKIEYDYQNDMVIYRKDSTGNGISTSYEDWKYRESNFDANPLNISLWNSLKIYQWGNEYSSVTSKGCGFNTITNSILECLNTCGNINYNTLNNGQITYNTLNNGQITYNTLENNGQITSNTLNNGRITSNTLNNGRITSNTLNNGRITSNTLNDALIDSNTLGNNGQIYSNTLENYGYINSNTLNSGKIHHNTLNSGQIHYNTLGNNGQIYHNTLGNDGQIRLGVVNPINNKEIQFLTINGGHIGGDTGIDLSSATLVYAEFTREVFKNSAGVTKIKYFNENDVLVIADITD